MNKFALTLFISLLVFQLGTACAFATGEVLFYYSGQNELFAVKDSKPVELKATIPLIIKRTYNPEDKTISEESLGIFNNEVKETVVESKVDGDKFTIAEKDGMFSGTGSLCGKSWKWNSWSCEVMMFNGDIVAGKFELNDKKYNTYKETFTAGEMKLVIKGGFDEITAEEYSKKYAEFKK